MKKTAFILAAVWTILLASCPFARAGEAAQAAVDVMGLTLTLPGGWIDLSGGVSGECREQIAQWSGDAGLADTLAGNLALDSVCWAALSPDGLVIYMNLYDIVLFDGCVSVREFSSEGRGIAAGRAAADYGLPSAQSVAIITLPNADFLLAAYGDSGQDGFCAVNYLFVWNGRLAGLEFVSPEALTPEELDTAEDIAASLSGELLHPPLNEPDNPLPVGSELAWDECALNGGIALALPDWMAVVDASDPAPGLARLSRMGVSDERLQTYRGFFDRDPDLLALFANAGGYHGYMIRVDSGLAAESGVDSLDGEALDALVERATANGYAREIVTSAQTAWYGGTPMLRVESREDAADSTYYTSYLFLSGDMLYMLVFMESREPADDETAFFDAVAASLSIPEEAAAPAGSPSNRNAVLLAVIAVVGLVALTTIAVSVILILRLARREPSEAAPAAPRRCARCGKELWEDDRYCSGCGGPAG